MSSTLPYPFDIQQLSKMRSGEGNPFFCVFLRVVICDHYYYVLVSPVVNKSSEEKKRGLKKRYLLNLNVGMDHITSHVSTWKLFKCVLF